ncbi:MAG: DUF2470 domain-containing protein [Alphaproteobacteria bacterium]
MTEATERGNDPEPAALARRLLRGAATGALATVARDAGGWPHASLVLVAVDHDATPVLLISDLAEHSRNIAADDRVSLLVDDTAGRDDPLTGARLSVQGRAAVSGEPRHGARFLARHPSAESYAAFGDFRFYRIAVTGAHLVAGFGRIHSIAAGGLLGDAPEALVAAEAGILAHMNDDHADAVALFARALLGSAGDGARLVGVDAEGCDIRLGPRLLRLDFECPIADPRDARDRLAALAREARAAADRDRV